MKEAMTRAMRDGLVDVDGDPHLVECAKVRSEMYACDCGSVPTRDEGGEEMSSEMTDAEAKIKNLVDLVDALDIEDRYDVIGMLAQRMSEEDRMTLVDELQGLFCFGCGESDPDHAFTDCPELVEDDQPSTPPPAERPS